jgi:hypothetical protein
MRLALETDATLEHTGRPPDTLKLQPTESPAEYWDKKRKELPEALRVPGREIRNDLAKLEIKLEPKERVEVLKRLIENVRTMRGRGVPPGGQDQVDVASTILAEALRGPLGLKPHVDEARGKGGSLGKSRTPSGRLFSGNGTQLKGSVKILRR